MTLVPVNIEGAMADDLEIRPEVAHRLGYYVYLYIDPRDGQPFYVGKGQGERALSHLSMLVAVSLNNSGRDCRAPSCT